VTDPRAAAPSGAPDWPAPPAPSYVQRRPIRSTRVPAEAVATLSKTPLMSSELPAARKAFVDAVQNETPGTDLPRYLAVLDALLAWTAARPDRLVFRPAGKRADVLRFERAKTKEIFWSAQVARADAPKLEIHLAAARPLSAEDRAEAMKTLNQYSRDALVEGERLRIGFGALKNQAALQAVLALMDRLLADTPAAGSAGSAGSAASG
jgi:hypothetical protein